MLFIHPAVALRRTPVNSAQLHASPNPTAAPVNELAIPMNPVEKRNSRDFSIEYIVPCTPSTVAIARKGMNVNASPASFSKKHDQIQQELASLF